MDAKQTYDITLDNIAMVEYILKQSRRLALELTTESAGADPDVFGFLELVQVQTNLGPWFKAFVWHRRPNQAGNQDDWMAFLSLNQGEDGCPQFDFEGSAEHKQMAFQAVQKTFTEAMAQA